MAEILLALILLQIKHWYIDFVNQTNEEVQYKGEYWDWRGMKHSIKHGLATVAVFLFFVDPEWAWVLGIVDFMVHYNIDWMKMNWSNRDNTTKAFWIHLGLDQMAHQLTYLALIAIVTL